MFPQILGNKSRGIATRFSNKVYKGIRKGAKVGALLGIGMLAGQARAALQDDPSDPSFDFSGRDSFEDFPGEFGSGQFQDKPPAEVTGTSRPQKKNPFDETGFPIFDFQE